MDADEGVGRAPEEGASSPAGQERAVRTGLACLEMISRHHALDVDVGAVVHRHALGDEDPRGATLLLIAREIGLKAKQAKLSWEDLAEMEGAYPLMGLLTNGNAVIFAGFNPIEGNEDGGELAVVDPLAGKPAIVFIPRSKLEPLWDGSVVFFKPARMRTDAKRPFGLSWFVPEILRQKTAFLYVAAAGLSLHLIGLVTPLFFQVVIDKVLTHNSYDTLTVLGAGVLLAVLFESVIGLLRNQLLLHTTAKLDVRLSTRAFAHLLRLPVSFFSAGSAGVTTKHMQQVERIREFLTGKLFSTVLDSWALLVFLPILAFYSLDMALLVLGFSAMTALTIFLIMPYFRRELQGLYQAEGSRQAMLVEAIHGMPTVKALAMEPVLGRKWADSTAASVTMQQRVGRTSLGAQAAIGFLEKAMTVAIVWIGALKVFSGTLTVGELIAIQMLAGRVSGPLVQLVTLINEFQQTALSVRMLGEIMNREPEPGGTGVGLRPALRGGVVFDDVCFSYPGAPAPALRGISLAIPPGSTVGVVGRSGSGKSTLLKLLQGMHTPSSGNIRFDGTDIREIDVAHLRRSLGAVPQESFIFKGTVRDNVAMTAPGVPFSEVVAAARLAGADEFVRLLPQGYDTHLDENAANLSGGQRQRLAIARALLNRPPILVFDEATSALDPESESAVQENMAAISSGRTVITVSHRLAALAHSDMIVVLDKGRVAAVGRHDELLRSCPIYGQLWSKQGRAFLGDVEDAGGRVSP